MGEVVKVGFGDKLLHFGQKFCRMGIDRRPQIGYTVPGLVLKRTTVILEG